MKHLKLISSVFLLILIGSCQNNTKKILVLFDNVETLEIDSKVISRGLVIGEVKKMNLYQDKVLVELAIQNDVHIPQGSSFSIVQNGLIDNGIVEVKFNSKTKNFMSSNDTIAGTSKIGIYKLNDFIDAVKKVSKKDSVSRQ